jgi:hypothetical protein
LLVALSVGLVEDLSTGGTRSLETGFKLLSSNIDISCSTTVLKWLPRIGYSILAQSVRDDLDLAQQVTLVVISIFSELTIYPSKVGAEVRIWTGLFAVKTHKKREEERQIMSIKMELRPAVHDPINCKVLTQRHLNFDVHYQILKNVILTSTCCSIQTRFTPV